MYRPKCSNAQCQSSAAKLNVTYLIVTFRRNLESAGIELCARVVQPRILYNLYLHKENCDLSQNFYSFCKVHNGIVSTNCS